MGPKTESTPSLFVDSFLRLQGAVQTNVRGIQWVFMAVGNFWGLRLAWITEFADDGSRFHGIALMPLSIPRPRQKTAKLPRAVGKSAAKVGTDAISAARGRKCSARIRSHPTCRM